MEMNACYMYIIPEVHFKIQLINILFNRMNFTCSNSEYCKNIEKLYNFKFEKQTVNKIEKAYIEMSKQTKIFRSYPRVIIFCCQLK